jgi:uncharacterized SAM-binding protein YcdF (DUF218 family)
MTRADGGNGPVGAPLLSIKRMPQFGCTRAVMNGPESAEAPAGSAAGDAAGRLGPGTAAGMRAVLLGVLPGAGLFFAGFALFATHVTELKPPVEPRGADAIIVLTGGQSRIDTALGLLQSGKGKRLLISGVNPAAGVDDLRAATGGDRNLFSCCVDIDHVALDTVGNAEESAKWIRDHDYGRVILVTNNYHMPRSLLEMRRLIGAEELDPYPVVNTSLDGGGWMSNPDALRVLFTEYNKYLLALARGVVPRSPGGDGFGVANASAAVD